MSGRGDIKGAVESGRRLLEEAVDAGIKRAQGPTAKPTLRRYTWSRLHTDILDDNRWALVALRAEAPLPIVEALVTRLEIHANKSSPRGNVGDFDAEAMAARWNVDAAMVLRILDELEAPQIGWIDQDQIVSFWPRNPDKVDETAAERQRRCYHRKKGMKLLATLARQGVISEETRFEREVALKDCKDPQALIVAWDTSRREAVRLTPRAEQIINEEAAGQASSVRSLGTNLTPLDPSVLAEGAKALQWLKGDGEALVTSRLGSLRSKACKQIESWGVTLCGDLTGLASAIHAALTTNAQGEAFRKLVGDQVARRAAEMIGGQASLKFVPVVAVRPRVAKEDT